ncbi:MAG: DUF4258 domain-containing protein [Candidatus Kuenenia stuttgartiensis]|nr:DUF4258 domain-containing protein [Candidatus Kuenenia stuttgartiensis]
MYEYSESCRQSAEKRILVLPHAVRQMSRPDRMISMAEVCLAIGNGELVEDYPEDVRGHSCLIPGQGESNRPIHVVCSPKTEYPAVITAYLLSEQEWEENFKRRKL